MHLIQINRVKEIVIIIIYEINIKIHLVLSLGCGT